MIKVTDLRSSYPQRQMIKAYKIPCIQHLGSQFIAIPINGYPLFVMVPSYQSLKCVYHFHGCQFQGGYEFPRRIHPSRHWNSTTPVNGLSSIAYPIMSTSVAFKILRLSHHWLWRYQADLGGLFSTLAVLSDKPQPGRQFPWDFWTSNGW